MAGISIKGLSKIYRMEGRDVRALSDINLTVEDGSFVTIVGRSGSGKTTLLRVLCGLAEKTSGEVAFTGTFPQDRRMPRISMVFQEPRLMPWLTVEQNMAFPLGRTGKNMARDIVPRYLKMMGLEGFKGAYPSQISGGMAQRAALGRALCYDPDLILMDEPLGALDAFTRTILRKELADLLVSQKKTVLFVTHDVEEAVYLGQKVVILQGRNMMGEVPVNLPYPRNTDSPEFFGLKQKILKVIMKESVSNEKDQVIAGDVSYTGLDFNACSHGVRQCRSDQASGKR